MKNIFVAFCVFLGFLGTFRSISYAQTSAPPVLALPQAAPATPAPVRFGATCSPAVPITFGEMPTVQGNWVAYVRTTQNSLFSPQISAAGVFDLSTGTDFFPAVAPMGSGSIDLFPKLVDHTLFFVRYGGGASSLMTLDIRSPNNFFVVEAGHVSPFFSFPGILWAKGGDNPYTVPDTFPIAWISRNFSGGGSATPNYCRVADCLQSNFSVALPSNALGMGPGESVGDIDSTDLFQNSNGVPAFVYSAYTPGGMYVMSYSNDTLAILDGPAASPAGFREVAMSSYFTVYTRVLSGTTSRVAVGMPGLAGVRLYESSPGPNGRDSSPSMSDIPSGSGKYLMAWTRSGAGGSGSVATYVDFSGQTLPPAQIELGPLLSSAGYSQCRAPSVHGADVVFSCTSPFYPNFPVVARSTCY